MRLVTIRIESSLKKIIDEYSKIYEVKLSDFVRDLVEIGISFKKIGGVSIIGPLNINTPLEEVSFGEEQARLNFFVDESLLGEAQGLFGKDYQSVLRRAIRLGFYCLLPGEGGDPTHYPPYKIIQHYQKEQMHRRITPQSGELSFKTLKYRQELAQMNYVDYVNRISFSPQIMNEMTNFLEGPNKENELIIKGKFGSGRSVLFNGLILMLNKRELRLLIQDSQIKRLIENNFGKYIIIRLSSRKLLNELREKLVELGGIESNHQLSLNELIKACINRNPGKHLLITVVLTREIDRNELIELVNISEEKLLILDEFNQMDEELTHRAHVINL
jgi:hypothetical protein